jgi:transcriptional regulator with XRE-family HTH domain
MYPQKTFGERFEALLMNHACSYNRAAEIMGVEKITVQRYARDDIEKVPFDLMMRLCRQIGADPWELAGIRPRIAEEMPPEAETTLRVILDRLRDFERRFDTLERRGDRPDG